MTTQSNTLVKAALGAKVLVWRVPQSPKVSGGRRRGERRLIRRTKRRRVRAPGTVGVLAVRSAKPPKAGRRRPEQSRTRER
jgi:hypothetical protein